MNKYSRIEPLFYEFWKEVFEKGYIFDESPFWENRVKSKAIYEAYANYAIKQGLSKNDLPSMVWFGRSLGVLFYPIKIKRTRSSLTNGERYWEYLLPDLEKAKVLFEFYGKNKDSIASIDSSNGVSNYYKRQALKDLELLIDTAHILKRNLIRLIEDL